MSFTISNTIYTCCSKKEIQSNKFTLVVDASLIGGSLLVAGLILGNVIGLPSGVNTIVLSGGLIGVAVTITSADIIAAILKSKQNAFESIKRQYFSNIKYVVPTNEAIKESKKIACNQIINRVYLGNSEAFAETSNFVCRFPDENGIMQPIDTSNPQEFTTIITACPLRSISSDYIDLMEKSPKEFGTSFESRGITWLYVGSLIEDEDKYWQALVYNCTSLNKDLAERPEKKLQKNEYEKVCLAKQTLLQKYAVQDWFEPVFQKIDEGVLKGKKVLVHCHGGQSRSATILAAYLIKRFGLTSEEAIVFLKSKRVCVDPKFSKLLNGYSVALDQAK